MRADCLKSKVLEKKGFTLIELLVVLSVISLLLGIILPVTSKARQSAKRIVCASNLRQLGIGLRCYLDDNRQIMPPAAMRPSLNLNSDKPITDFLLPYVDNPEVFKCPADMDEKFYRAEGSSYEYNSMLAGKVVTQTWLSKRLDAKERNIHVLYDYEPFHGKAGKKGGKNYLYADGHVGDLSDQ
jgi:prepilin-type N-terminal cleavage/methylation domain-containing protein/prepilin-type processing-associated H-X9-DG protein